MRSPLSQTCIRLLSNLCFALLVTLLPLTTRTAVAQDIDAVIADAESGNAVAQAELALRHHEGRDVMQNFAMAAEWARKAAEGDTDRLSPGGVTQLLYDPRLALPPQDEAGLRKLDQMARAGDPVAEFQLAYLFATAPDTPPSALTDAVRLFESAADAGYGPAMANLGILYFVGRGAPQDFELGLMWLILAEFVGQAEVSDLVEKLSEIMSASQIEQARHRVNLRTEKNP